MRLVNSRAEEFFAAAGSVPATVRVKTGVKKDGTITARAMDFTWDTGAYAEGLAGSNRALKDGVGPINSQHSRRLHVGIYEQIARLPVSRLGHTRSGLGRRIKMDMISAEARHRSRRAAAEKLPRHRRRNSGRRSRPPYCAARMLAESRRRAQALEEARAGESRLRRRVAAQIADHFGVVFKRACASTPNGKVELFIGATDVGGGTGTSLGQIVAEELAYRSTTVRVVIADTELTPFDHGTYSSRVTPYVGAAVKLAAADARRQINCEELLALESAHQMRFVLPPVKSAPEAGGR